jgi:hypothetical protein
MGWLQRIRNSIRPGRIEHDIDRELSFHIAETVDELRAQAVSEEDHFERRGDGSATSRCRLSGHATW